MTVDERKMAIAYADLLNIQELVQHILQMDADELFKPETRKVFAQIAFQLDNVVSDVGHYISTHTDFNKDTSDKAIESKQSLLKSPKGALTTNLEYGIM